MRGSASAGWPSRTEECGSNVLHELSSAAIILRAGDTRRAAYCARLVHVLHT